MILSPTTTTERKMAKERGPHRTVDIQAVAQAARERFVLGPRSVHGPAHRQRVMENGLKLARLNQADQELVELFALLHDCCREGDGADMLHGPRAAALMKTWRADLLAGLEPERFNLLHEAVRDHTLGKVHKDITIGTCWDADRLDIGRVGRKIQPGYLSTREAKKASIIRWAYDRSRGIGPPPRR